MQIMIRIIIPALIPFVLGILLSNIEKNNGKELLNNLQKEHIVLHLPKAYIGIGALTFSFAAVCLIAMFLEQNSTATLWVLALFSLLALLGIVIIAVTIIWRIDVFRNEDYFLLRTLTVRCRKIKYCECLSYKLTMNSLTIKTVKRTIRIDSNAANLEVLAAMLTRYKVDCIE